MIEPHIIQNNGQPQVVEAWVKCSKCNNSMHRILPGQKTPYWWCQDEKQQLQEDEEIEVEYLDTEPEIICG